MRRAVMLGLLALVAGLCLLLWITRRGETPEQATDLAATRRLLEQQRFQEARDNAHVLVEQYRQSADSLQLAAAQDLFVESLWRLRQASDPEVYRQAVETLGIRERHLHPTHSDIARSLLLLGRLDLDLGSVEPARQRFERALAIVETDAASAVIAADCLAGLGFVDLALGAYPSAAQRFETAVQRLTVSTAVDSLAWASALNGLAQARVRLGDYRSARSGWETALAIRRAVLGDTHVLIASLLINLANVTSIMGDFENALEMYENALTIQRREYGEAHPQTATTLLNLALLQERADQFATAHALYHRTLAIRRRLNTGPAPALILDNLGELFLAQAQYDSAAIYFQQALDLWEAELGLDHPMTSLAVLGLGAVAFETGHFDTALERFTQVRQTRARSQGTEHPEYAEGLAWLARTQVALGNAAGALPLALEAERIGREHVRLCIQVLAEREALAYDEVRIRSLDTALSLVTAPGVADARSVRDVWEGVMASRGLVLEEMMHRRQVADVEDPAEAELLDKLAAASRALANETLAGSGAGDAAAYRSRLEAARKAKESVERQLAQVSERFRNELDVQQATIQNLADALPEASALVAYIVSPAGVSPDKTTSTAAPEAATAPMVAFVLDARGRCSVHDLGESAGIDSLVAAWSREIRRDVSTVGRNTAAAESTYSLHGTALRQVIWDPVREAVGRARTIFVVPDGAINLVSFAALPADGGGYLAEGLAFHYLAAERDLVRDAQSAGHGLLVFGGAAFDSHGVEGEVLPVAHTMERMPGTRAAAPCGDSGTLHFRPLAETLGEATDVLALWREASPSIASEAHHLLSGAQATETAFKRLAPGRRAVHVATHGFFLGTACEEAGDGKRAIDVVPAPARKATLVAEELALVQSGLAFAGANRAVPAADGEDGILTAEEVAAMDLRGVEWMVLSGCDTGVGRIRSGEGVLGMRRAFQVAGAGAIVMSLWPVDDAATRQWMQVLYRARYRDGSSSTDAVRSADAAILRDRRAHQQSVHPFYWAGFVVSGSWR